MSLLRSLRPLSFVRATAGKATPHQLRNLPNLTCSPKTTRTSTSATSCLTIRSFTSHPSLCRPHDTSTVDRCYLPRIPDTPARQEWVTVPFLPDNYNPLRSPMTDAAVDTAVIRPEISLMAHESTYVHPPSAMSEVTDNSAMTIDPFDLTKRVTEAATNAAAQAARQLGAKHAEVVLKEKGTLGEVWSGFLDDLFGGPSIKSA